MKKPLLELVMIVKDSGLDIIPMLKASKPYIDSWTILDTGSTDGTQKNILSILGDIPGNLYEEPFVDFSVSRNRALELAGDKCEWVMMLDDTYELQKGDNLRNFLKSKKCKKKKALLITIEDSGKRYVSLRLIRTNSGLRYKYRIHEYIEAVNPHIIEYSVCHIYDTSSVLMGARSNQRHYSDYKILKEDYEKFPDDSRLCFYLARTCQCIGMIKESVEYYEKRVEMGGDITEIYESTLALMGYKLFDNSLTEEEIIKMLKKYNNCEDVILIAITFYYMKKDFSTAYFLADNFYKLDEKEINTSIHVKRKCAEMDIVYLYIDLHFLTDRFPKGILILKKMLEENPCDIRLNNIKNAITNPSINAVVLEKPTFVIHAGDKKFITWDPEYIVGKNSLASGSEIMAVNVAERMEKRGFRCFIFGNFNFERKVVNNVEYINYQSFIEFSDNYVIDWLVVSRSSENIYYSHYVKKVYLWMHDVGVINDSSGFLLQTHQKKFKKVLCLCEWHKNNSIKNIGVPEDKIAVTRNAIDTSRFVLDYEVIKQPLRFIYLSCPVRGLTRLLHMFPTIKKRYPEAELFVFCNETQLDKEQTSLLESPTNGVKYFQRISQEQIATELKKSDIWFYPTNFLETYCIAAVEAQASEVLCVSSDIGSLGEIVGGRGVTFPGDSTDEFMLEKLFSIIDDPERKSALTDKAKDWAMKQDFDTLIDDWIEMYRND